MNGKGKPRGARSGFALPALYPITDRGLAGGLAHGEIGRLLVEAGAHLFQVREKHLSDADLLAQVMECVGLPSAVVVVNDRPDVALIAGAAGVHLGGEDLPPEEARSILGPGRIIGLSTHSVEEAVAASDLDIDYVALGPIFESATKASGRAPLGLASLARAARRMSRPLVAIGGITLDRAPSVWEAGADAVAVVSDLMASGDIGRRAREYLARARGSSPG